VDRSLDLATLESDQHRPYDAVFVWVRLEDSGQGPLGSWRTVIHDKNDVIGRDVPLESMPLVPLQDGAQALLRKSSPKFIGNVLNKPPASTGLTVSVAHGNGRKHSFLKSFSD